jgi:steroid delta-isomerase-like uncharacterized protein
MSDEENKALVRRSWGDLFAAKDFTLVEALVAPDFVWHGGNRTPMGRDDGWKARLGPFLAAFPDAAWVADDQLAQGDRVATRWTASGTHLANFRDVPPTGRRVVVSGMVISRIANGQVAEEWETVDWLGLLDQLGATAARAQEG